MIQVTRQGRGPRLIGVMGVILGFSIGFAAIKSPNIYSGQVVIIMSVATLLVAALGAIHCTPKVFWFGFAAVGWASMLLAAEFWFAEIEREPNLLGAAIFHRYYEQEYNHFSRGFEYGDSQFRKIVFPQIALVQALIGGLLAFLLTREHMPSLRRIGDWVMPRFWIVLAIATTLLTLRFCDEIASTVYIHVVTIALVTATLGSFVGGHRRTCAAAAMLGWVALLWNVYGPVREHPGNSMAWRLGSSPSPFAGRSEPPTPPKFIAIGPAEKFFALIYPQSVDPSNTAYSEPSLSNTYRSVLFGEPHLLTLQPPGLMLTNPFSSTQFQRFSLVAGHAAALVAMCLGAAAGMRIERRTRRAVVA